MPRVDPTVKDAFSDKMTKDWVRGLIALAIMHARISRADVLGDIPAPNVVFTAADKFIDEWVKQSK